MRDNTPLTEDDEGKAIINAEGNQIGRVVKVEHGNAHVDPDPSLTDTIRSKLGWGKDDVENYRLDSSDIKHITDDEIHLNR